MAGDRNCVLNFICLFFESTNWMRLDSRAVFEVAYKRALSQSQDRIEGMGYLDRDKISLILDYPVPSTKS